MRIRRTLAFVSFLALLLGAAFGVIFVLHGGSRSEGPTAVMVGDGQKAPDFTLDAADGNRVSLADYTGKKNVLLYFSMAYG